MSCYCLHVNKNINLLCVCVFSCSVMSNTVTPRTVACQAPLSMGLSWQEYCSRLPFPPSWIEGSNPLLLSPLHWQVDSLPPSYLGLIIKIKKKVM